MLLPPDTDEIKNIYPGDAIDKSDYLVKFEGLENYLGFPAPCDIYLGRVAEKRRSKAQVLFWQLTGDHSTTQEEDKANMGWMEVAVRINVGSELRGEGSSFEEGYHLNHRTRATGEVAVIFPVLVNHKYIDRKEQLLVYKEKAPEPEGAQKRPAPTISNARNWEKQFGSLSKTRRLDEL